MDVASGERQPGAAKQRAQVERRSERELVVTRTVNAPARIAFEAWTRSDLFQRWWVPKSCGATLDACELDVRVGGSYRLVFRHPAAPEPMAFHGRYLEVVPPSRLVWTNEEGEEGGAVTTVTFTENGGQTLLVKHDLYPSKEALEAAIASARTMGEGDRDKSDPWSQWHNVKSEYKINILFGDSHTEYRTFPKEMYKWNYDSAPKPDPTYLWW